MTPDLLAFLTPQERQLVAPLICDCDINPCALHPFEDQIEGKLLTSLAEARKEREGWKHHADSMETQRDDLQRSRDATREDAAHKEMDAFNLSQRLMTMQAHLAQCRADRNQLVIHNEELSVQVMKLKVDWSATDGSPVGILQAKLAQAREALRKYGRHRKGCPMAGYPDDVGQPIPGVAEQCTCGLDARLA